MKKNIILTVFASLTLVLAFAASALATPIWTSAMGSTLYEWDGGWTSPSSPGGKHPDYPVWNESATVGAGSASSLTFTMNLTLRGSWDNKFDATNTNADEWDYFHVQIYKGTTLLADNVYNFDNAEGLNPQSQTITVDLPYDPGVYYFKAWGEVTAGSNAAAKVGQDVNERWTLENANLTPTPLPGAVWLLGSGLLGFMGFKRTRRNEA